MYGPNGTAVGNFINPAKLPFLKKVFGKKSEFVLPFHSISRRLTDVIRFCNRRITNIDMLIGFVHYLHLLVVVPGQNAKVDMHSGAISETVGGSDDPSTRRGFFRR